jgi:uncharacterized protein YukJ
MAGLKSYGVVVGRCVHFEREDDDPKSPHCHLTVEGDGKSFRAAVNVKSKVQPSELVFHHAAHFVHPITDKLRSLTAGSHRLENNPQGGALDYIRGNLFPLTEVIALPPFVPGADNDLSDLVEGIATRAINDPDAVLYIFGEPFNGGIHGIHMNQGNVEPYVQHNGVWQDGGLLVYTPSLDRWTALFLAFQSQAIHTDDASGNAIEGSLTYANVVTGDNTPRPIAPTKPDAVLPPPGQRDLTVRIVSAMVNPVGGEGQPGFSGESEWVQLLGMIPREVDLTGWSVLNRDKVPTTIAEGVKLPAAGLVRIPVDPAAALGNRGGLITLLDADGLKVHGVSYTEDQARKEGYPVGF